MTSFDQRPSNGGGSCARCKDGLGLASTQLAGVWYCGSACAEGRGRDTSSAGSVPESWLYARPRRFYGRRAPKELQASGAGARTSHAGRDPVSHGE